MAESSKTLDSKELQAEIEAVAGDKSRDQVEEMIEQIKGPRKIINNFVAKHSEFVKTFLSNETTEAVEACGTVVAHKRESILALAEQLLTNLEHWRWLVDERIAIMRRQEALAKDKYGNERKPLELSPEEQELSYDLRGAAMRNSYEQTQALTREFRVTRMLTKARQDVFDMVNQPLSQLSRQSMFKLIAWYKRQLESANQRAQKAEEKLAAIESDPGQKTGMSTPSRPKSVPPPVMFVGPADVKHLEEKLSFANRELDYLRKRVNAAERELTATRQKLSGSEDVIERLAKITNRERQKSARLDRELTRVTEVGLASYSVAHRTYSSPPHLLPTTSGDATPSFKRL